MTWLGDPFGPMQPEEELRADHMAIRRGLKLLENLTDVLREGHPVENTDLYTLVDVLDQATRENHQAKEDQIVFEFLRDHREKFGFDGLRHFEQDHDELAERLAELRDTIEPATEGDQRARQSIKKQAHGYADAMREHLEAEEQTFLDQLHENLTNDEIGDLGDRMAEFDGQPKARSRLDDRVERLQDRYEDRL